LSAAKATLGFESVAVAELLGLRESNAVSNEPTADFQFNGYCLSVQTSVAHMVPANFFLANSRRFWEKQSST
jgi:hypothetical protein